MGTCTNYNHAIKKGEDRIIKLISSTYVKTK